MHHSCARTQELTADRRVIMMTYILQSSVNKYKFKVTAVSPTYALNPINHKSPKSMSQQQHGDSRIDPRSSSAGGCVYRIRASAQSARLKPCPPLATAVPHKG
ncbi:hypothetical protein EVAR_11611_1 [Eumeta japonica]|uniref:Uncharacterized protein n=1 Tax=Eumeta variegata TaxID=151549 RepID=A0A4C1WVF2_EUMVA|nr:hypothetical protein EVAR_11611_1 [Eumeta japonica]